MKKLLFLLSIVAMRPIHGQTFVTIPDTNFATYLQNIIPAAMNGYQMDTSSSLVKTVTKIISVDSKNIHDLNGIQYFLSLQYLSCNVNNLSSIPSLPGTITYLDCAGNQLTALPSLPNSLTYLNFYGNPLTSLSALPPFLDTLICGGCSLLSLPALPNSLTYLECNQSQFNSIPTLPVSLLYFICADNPLLQTLPNLPNSLLYLKCSNNNLTSLPALPSSLFYLDCYYNVLSTLPSLPNSLNYLSCYHNNITCFPVFPDSITYLDISLNSFNCLPNYIPQMSAAELATPLCAAGNSNGCPIATGIEQVSFRNSQVTIYPSPTSDQFYIEANATDKLNVDLYDVNGRHVLRANVSGKSNINVATLDNGIYSLLIKTADGVTNKKLVISH